MASLRASLTVISLTPLAAAYDLLHLEAAATGVETFWKGEDRRTEEEEEM